MILSVLVTCHISKGLEQINIGWMAGWRWVNLTSKPGLIQMFKL